MEKKNTPKRGRGRPRKYPKPEAVKPEEPAQNGVLTLPATPTPQPSYNNGTLTIPTATDIAAEVVKALRRELPIVARIAAADVMHSSMPAEKVFDHAIKEGRLAAAVWSAQNEVRRG